MFRLANIKEKEHLYTYVCAFSLDSKKLYNYDHQHMRQYSVKRRTHNWLNTGTVVVVFCLVFDVCLLCKKKCLNNNGKRIEAIRDNLAEQFLCKI